MRRRCADTPVHYEQTVRERVEGPTPQLSVGGSSAANLDHGGTPVPLLRTRPSIRSPTYRGLCTFTFQLNVSAFCKIGSSYKGGLGGFMRCFHRVSEVG